MKKAFTMLELVFVIVVIGILAAAILPRMDRDTAAEAAIRLQSDIRYTQHLALIDDKYDAGNANWAQNRWQIAFTNNSYTIASNNGALAARDPETGNAIAIDLNDEYGATIDLSNCDGGATVISFDHLGRPMTGNLSATPYPALGANNGSLLTGNCVISVTADGETHNITIFPETGYVQGI